MTARLLTCAALAFTLTGCGLWPFSKSSAQEQPQAQRMVRIDWYGFQCFRIKSALGLSILTNPFSPGTTDFAQPKNLTPEILLCTTESPDTNFVNMPDNTPNILRSAVGVGTGDQVLQQTTGSPVAGKIIMLVAIILFLQWKPGGLFAIRSRSLD